MGSCTPVVVQNEFEFHSCSRVVDSATSEMYDPSSIYAVCKKVQDLE